jgi:restriction system protein
MGRRASVWRQLAAAQARQAKEAERLRRAEARERERIQREAQRAQERLARQWEKDQAKQQKEAYLASRKAEADAQTRNVAQRLVDLETLLVATLSVDDAIDFRELYPSEPFVPPRVASVEPIRPPDRDAYFSGVSMEPGLLERLFGFGRNSRQAAIDAAEQQYTAAVRQHEIAVEQARTQEEQNQRTLQQARLKWDAEQAAKRSEVDAFRKAYESGDAEAITAYCAMVLERSQSVSGNG